MARPAPDFKPTNRIRECRKGRGRSLAWVAERIGVTPAEVSRWERGTREPRLDHMRRLARVLDVSAGDLLLEDDNPMMARDEIERGVLQAMRDGEEIGAPVRAFADTLIRFQGENDDVLKRA